MEEEEEKVEAEEKGEVMEEDNGVIVPPAAVTEDEGHLRAAFDFVYLAAIDIPEQKACGFIMGTIAYHSTPWRYRTTAP